MKGDLWYEDGKLLNKQNTFTDFLSVVEYFIQQGYTTPDQLAVHGKSAGGLLMGAVLTMRPDLFKVVWAQVPFFVRKSEDFYLLIGCYQLHVRSNHPVGCVGILRMGKSKE
jgi:hypothetical protein